MKPTLREQGGGVPLYAGPRPSPARRWAPWVALAAILTVAADLAAMILELVERRWQQRLAAGHAVAPGAVRTAVARIQDAHNVAVGAAWVAAVLWVVWATRRRTRKRIAVHGEVGVETPLRAVAPWAFGLVVLALVAALACNQIGLGELPSTGRSAADFASYRGWRAASWFFEAVLSATLAIVVVIATGWQARREAADPAECVPPQPVTRPFSHRIEMDARSRDPRSPVATLRDVLSAEMRPK